MRLDDAYANAAYISGAEAFPPMWAKAAASFRATAADCFQRLNYGPSAREVMDIFWPQTPPKGLMVFVHGGYWKAFDGTSWSHLAAGAIANGWAVAVPTYTLAPEARISDITQQIAVAISKASDLIEGPIILTGHSAGGHLVARMCMTGVLPETVAARLQKVVPISPVADLRPLLETSMNAELQLDEDEAHIESPVFATFRHDVPVTVWVGAEERPAFLQQAHDLGQAWNCTVVEDAGRHHFDVIASLEHPDSPLMREVLHT